jgi:hypothetical protein
MTTITSGSQVKDGECAYATSEPESWGQPSASCYVFMNVGERLYGQLISGIYVSSHPGFPTSAFLGYEEEPEDDILVSSGILPQLIAQARSEPPSLDWERDLDEL